MNVLANDGISNEGVLKLKSAGFNVSIESINQDEIINHIKHLVHPLSNQ